MQIRFNGNQRWYDMRVVEFTEGHKNPFRSYLKGYPVTYTRVYFSDLNGNYGILYICSDGELYGDIAEIRF